MNSIASHKPHLLLQYAGNIAIIGSDVSAGHNVSIDAEGQLDILAAKSTSAQHSTNSSQGTSVGVGFAMGGAQNLELAASKARGNADGNDTSYTNSHITGGSSAGDTVTLTSGSDTTLKGAVIAADTVKAEVGGNLNIESLQDRSSYTSRQSSSGVSLSVSITGVPTGGGISASKSNIDSNYQSVTQQSGIKAGDGGFQVDVAGNTDLKGAVIASSDKAVNDRLNSFTTGGELTTSDIHNTASYSGKSTGISINVGQQAGKYGVEGVGVGIGKDEGDAGSTTSSGISGIAANTAVRSTDPETGIARIFDADKVQREINAQMVITQAFSKEAPKAVADFAAKQGKDLKEQAKAEQDAGKEAALLAEAAKWDEGGTYRIALHTATGALGGGVSGAAGAAASASAANLMNDFQDSIQQGLQTAGLSAGSAKAIAQGIAGLTAAGVGAAVGGAQGAATAATVDMNNRQLHPTEEQWLKTKAKDFAKEKGISEKEATDRLTQQALKEVDYLWRAQLADGDDISAKAFLIASNQTFINDLGEQQKLFTTTGQQLFRPEMFADTANPAFYKQFAQSGITRSLTTGLAKELQDSGIDLKNGAIDLAKAVKDNPGAALEGVWKAVRGLPQSVVDGFKETGTAIGEGAAVALSKDLTDKLNAIYGTDTAGAQQALLAIRITAALTGATGAAKVGANLTETTAKAVGKKLDEVLDQKAWDAVVKSGGIVDKTTGQSMLDLKQLTTKQKEYIGEIFGENTVRQIVPDGTKLGRAAGVGGMGLDDLYKVSRTDVDYVFVEYKFVGDLKKAGTVGLDTTTDGLQGSQGWLTGSGRIENAVGEAAAPDVRRALRAGRTETWLVRTGADGSTEVQVLDALGKPKPIDTSKIILPGTSLFGAQK